MPHQSFLRSPRSLLILVLTIALLSLAACGSSDDAVAEAPVGATPAGTAAETPIVAPTAANVAVPWSEADSRIGQMTTIEGPVVAAFYADTESGEPTFLNVGRDYPDSRRFTVVIWGDDRRSFPDAPESMYEGKIIRVTGDVSEYDGRAQIVVTSPDAIEVAE